RRHHGRPARPHAGARMSASAREAIAAVGRHEAADLQDELVAVPEPDAPRVAWHEAAGTVGADGAAEREQPPGPRPAAPDTEDVAQPLCPGEANYAGRVGRPDRAPAPRHGDAPEAALRGAYTDRGRNDDDTATREQLEVHARAAAQGRRHACAAHAW